MFKKIKKFFKSLMATTLSASTTISGIAAVTAQTASAAGDWVLETGTIVGVAFRLRKSGTTHSYYHNDATTFTLTNKNTGESLIVFCMEPGHTTKAGNSYGDGEAVSVAWGKISEAHKRNINNAGLYFLYNGSGQLGSSYNENMRIAVQWYIWYNAGLDGSTGTGQDYDTIAWDEMRADAVDRGKGAKWDAVKAEYDKLIEYMNNASKKPSMQPDAATSQKFKNGAYQVEPGDVLTFYDVNAVLWQDKYEVVQSTTPGVTVAKDGNKMTITIGANYYNVNKVTIPAISEHLTIRNNANNNQFKFLIFTGDDIQELVSPYAATNLVDPSDLNIPIQSQMGKIRVEKYDKEYGDALANTTFDIYYSNGQKATSVTTGSDGSATTDWLKFDTYTVKEVNAPTGYNNDNAAGKTVVLNGESASVEFYDKIIQGWVSINKTDKTTGQKLQGAVFSIYKTAGVSGKAYNKPMYIGDMPATDANGYAKSGLLDYGQYYLVEKTAAYGYYNPQTHYTFNITQEGVTVPVNITNDRQTLEINVVKQDDNSDGFGVDAQGNKLKLEGAKFGLYQHVILRDAITNIKYYENDILVETATSNANGLAKFELQTAYTSDLQFDSYYYVKEIEAPKGYKLNNKEVKLTYEYGDQFQKAVVVNMTVENEIKKAPISVYKQDLETGEYLAGAVFEIRNSKNVVVDTVTTTKEGKAVSKDLRPGAYKVTEITAPDHYQLSNIKDWGSNVEGTLTKDVEITIAEDAEGIFNAVGVETQFKNLHDKGKIKIVKVDGLTVDYKQTCDENDENCIDEPVITDESVLLPNVEFAVFAKDDLTNPVFTGKTDENGEISVVLNTGEYYIQEISAPEGYNVNPSLMLVKLVNHGDEVEKVITNMTVYGEISIYKIGETLVDAVKDEETGVTDLKYANTYVGGVEFEIYADEDIYHPLTKKLIYAKDELVRKVTTGTDGKVVLTDMALGSYYVKEVTAPEGHSVYDATSDIKYITLSEEDANFEGVIEDEARFVNERLMIDPQLYKVGAHIVSDTNEETVYEYTALPGAIFGVYNEEDIVYQGEDDEELTVPAGTLLGLMETDEEGFADVQIKIPFGKYYVQEIQAPEGYYLNEEKYPFELVWEQEMQNENVLTVEVVDSENPIINYEIVIPQTGVNTMLYSTVGVIVIALAGAAVIIRKKRDINE